MGIHFNHKSRAGDRKMQKELKLKMKAEERKKKRDCLLYTSPSPRDTLLSRMPSSA